MNTTQLRRLFVMLPVDLTLSWLCRCHKQRPPELTSVQELETRGSREREKVRVLACARVRVCLRGEGMRRQETVRSRTGRGLSKTRGKKSSSIEAGGKRRRRGRLRERSGEMRDGLWVLERQSNNQNQIHEQILK